MSRQALAVEVEFSERTAWQLLLQRAGGAPIALQRPAPSGASLLHYWFVQYNPLFFFSAACILLGVYEVSLGLQEMDWRAGQFGLAATVQAYELLLIGAAALLFRRATQRRPAIVLALLQLVFLFDTTLQTEILGTLGGAGLAAGLIWIVSVPLKLSWLRWVFRLNTSPEFLVVPTLAALGIAAMPHVLGAAAGQAARYHLGATWYFVALIVVVHELRPRIFSMDRLDHWGATVVRRAGMALWSILGLLCVLHLLAWLSQFGIGLTPSHAAPFLVLAAFLVRPRQEVWSWLFCGTAVAVSTSEPATASATAAFAGLALSWLAHREEQPRFLVGAVISFYFAALTLGWSEGALPEPPLWLGLVTAAVLAGLLAVRPSLTALLATIAILIPHARMLTPRDRLETGIALLALGFVALVLGVAVNWDRRTRRGLAANQRS